jgi:hypothetical protein
MMISGSIVAAAVIARSNATKQSIPSARRDGLLRSARNDDSNSSIAL